MYKIQKDSQLSLKRKVHRRRAPPKGKTCKKLLIDSLPISYYCCYVWVKRPIRVKSCSNNKNNYLEKRKKVKQCAVIFLKNLYIQTRANFLIIIQMIINALSILNKLLVILTPLGNTSMLPCTSNIL